MPTGRAESCRWSCGAAPRERGTSVWTRKWWSCANLPGESEICKLDYIPFDEQILGLHIPVEVAILVHKVKRLYGLEHYVSDLVRRERLCPPLDVLVQIPVHVLEDKV